MPSSSPLLPILLLIIPAIYASPIALDLHSLHERAPSPSDVGTGFGVTIAIVVFASLVFYLGVIRGRTGTWFCWRSLPPSSRPLSYYESIHVLDTNMIKSKIGSPMTLHSSALPELSPIEVRPCYVELATAKPKALELCATDSERAAAIFEMGLASPRRPPSVMSSSSRTFYESRKSSIASMYRKSIASVKSVKTIGGKTVYSSQERPPKVNSWFDNRKSWFCRGAMEVEDEEKRARDGEEGSTGDMVAAPAATAVVPGRRETVMDWSGMEWISNVYNGRKSRRLSGMRSFYHSGDER